MSKPTQQPRDFRDFVCGNDFRIRDVLTFTGAGDLDTAGAVLRLTVRHPTTRAIIGQASTEPGGGIEKLSATAFEAVILPAVTALWPANARLPYDLQLSFSDSDESYTLWVGKIETLPAITQAQLSAPPGPLELVDSDEIAVWLARENWTAASWTDQTGNLQLVQATGSQQFTSSVGPDGNLWVLGDGVDDTMTGLLTSPVAAGARPYALSIYSLASGDPGSGNRVAWFASSASASVLLSNVQTYSSARHRTVTFRTTNGYSLVGPAPDTSAHVVEHNFEASVTDRYFVDGTAYNTVFDPSFPVLIDALPEPLERVTLGTSNPVARIAALYSDIVLLRSMPSPETVNALRTWAQYRIDGIAV